MRKQRKPKLNGKANLAGGNTFTGNQTIGGSVILPAVTSGAGASASQPLQLAGSDASNNPTAFQWLVNSAGNLDLQTASGGNAIADSGLMIASNGQITFAAGQTFPGTNSGTVTNVATGTGLTGGPITTTGTISIDTTVVPQLGAASNTFTGAFNAGSFTGNGAG